MKLSWPLSTREALLHYFEFEYLEGDLLVVLLNTVIAYITLSMRICFSFDAANVKIKVLNIQLCVA